MIRPPKKRKPRTTGEDMCPWCISFGCNTLNRSPKFDRKIQSRIDKGLCPACGHQPCRCKSGSRLFDISKWPKAKLE